MCYVNERGGAETGILFNTFLAQGTKIMALDPGHNSGAKFAPS